MKRNLKQHLSQLTSPELEDLVDLVSIDEPVIVNEGATDNLGNPLPRIAAIDCGIKVQHSSQPMLSIRSSLVPPAYLFQGSTILRYSRFILFEWAGRPCSSRKSNNGKKHAC